MDLQLGLEPRGYSSCTIWDARAFASAAAAVGGTSGLSRATALWLYMEPKPASSSLVKLVGTYTSAGRLLLIGPRLGNTKPRGITPTTV